MTPDDEVELILGEIPDVFRRQKGTPVEKIRAFVCFYQLQVEEIRAAYAAIPDSLNRPLVERIKGLAERANNEAEIAVKLRNRLEEIKPGSSSDI